MIWNEKKIQKNFNFFTQHLSKKKNKSESYEKEYGTDTIEVQKNLLKEGTNVLLVDDLLATGLWKIFFLIQ